MKRWRRPQGAAAGGAGGAAGGRLQRAPAYDWVDIDGKIADAVNDIAATHCKLAGAVEPVSSAVGAEKPCGKRPTGTSSGAAMPICAYPGTTAIMIGTACHDARCDDQALAPSDAVDVGTQHDGAQRPHQETGAEGHEGEKQGTDCVLGRNESLGDVGGVETEQEEIEHFEKVATRNAQHHSDFRLLLCGK
jgi:hypothetical protein